MKKKGRCLAIDFYFLRVFCQNFNIYTLEFCISVVQLKILYKINSNGIQMTSIRNSPQNKMKGKLLRTLITLSFK